MGSLILPRLGPIFVDTQIVIYSVEAKPPYWSLLRPLWQAVRSGQPAIIGSELTLMECLVVPLRNNDATLAATYDQIFQSAGVRLLPISQSVLREAARLRATIPGLRTSDAIHAATALLEPCTLFLTNDQGFRRIPGLPVTVLDDVIAAP